MAKIFELPLLKNFCSITSKFQNPNPFKKCIFLCRKYLWFQDMNHFEVCLPFSWTFPKRPWTELIHYWRDWGISMQLFVGKGQLLIEHLQFNNMVSPLSVHTIPWTKKGFLLSSLYVVSIIVIRKPFSLPHTETDLICLNNQRFCYFDLQEDKTTEIYRLK